ncbi:MAG: questin oxidase family protein [Candidatus Binatia bacterium]
MLQPSYIPLDEALSILLGYGPDLRNGLTNHAPMAVEAMCAMGRPEAILPWLEHYRQGMLPRPERHKRIDAQSWRKALAQEKHVEDWAEFFREELQQAPWQDVLQRWIARLAPGLSGSATHGVIRVGHAVRSLDQHESPERLHELADALAYMAATYQELPTPTPIPNGRLSPSTALTQVPVVPEKQRRFAGTITSSLGALSEFPAFAPVIGLIDVMGDASTVLSQLTETFARVYLANTHDILTAIVFIHGVTSATALRSLLPHVSQETARAALRYGWQAGCSLYTTFGSRPDPVELIAQPQHDQETLIDMAITHGDEHAIKFMEACLREYALNPSPAYLAAARHALGVLPTK